MPYGMDVFALILALIVTLALAPYAQLKRRHAENMGLMEPGEVYGPDGKAKPALVPIPIRSRRWFVGLYILAVMQAVTTAGALSFPSSLLWMIPGILFVVAVVASVGLYVNYRHAEDRQWGAMANSPAPPLLHTKASR